MKHHYLYQHLSLYTDDDAHQRENGDNEAVIEHWTWVIAITLTIWVFTLCVACLLWQCKYDANRRCVRVERRTRDRRLRNQQSRQQPQECLHLDYVKQRIVIETATQRCASCCNDLESQTILDETVSNDTYDEQINKICLTCASMYPSVCAICLSDFEAGDKVAHSNNMNCRHSFHASCVIPWLQRQKICPMCRCHFLIPNGRSTENGDTIVATDEIQNTDNERAY